MSRTTIGARPRLISSHSSSFGFDISARPMRHHLLLAAGQRGAGLGAALGQHRKQLVDGSQRPRPGPLELAADQKIFLDAERREQAAGLPAPARCRARRPHGPASPPIGAPSKTIASRPRRQQPGDAFEQRALAGAIGSDHRDRLAAADFEADAEQRLDVAIESVERSDGEERLRHPPRSPDRSPPPRGCE